MPFEEKRKKTGGRQKGTANKTTARQRELLASFMEDKFPEFCKMYDKMEPEDKVRTYVQMLPYVTPKMQSVQMDLDATVVDSIDEELKKLSEDF